MDELGTENRIAVERTNNERVQDYSITRRGFPRTSWRAFSVSEYPLFNAPPAAERSTKVNFGKGRRRGDRGRAASEFDHGMAVRALLERA